MLEQVNGLAPDQSLLQNQPCDLMPDGGRGESEAGVRVVTKRYRSQVHVTGATAKHARMGDGHAQTGSELCNAAT